MLVLSRRFDEAIVVQTSDGPIRFVVAGFNGAQVKIGVECDKKIPVYREELLPHATPPKQLTPTSQT